MAKPTTQVLEAAAPLSSLQLTPYPAEHGLVLDLNLHAVACSTLIFRAMISEENVNASVIVITTMRINVKSSLLSM